MSYRFIERRLKKIIHFSYICSARDVLGCESTCKPTGTRSRIAYLLSAISLPDKVCATAEDRPYGCSFPRVRLTASTPWVRQVSGHKSPIIILHRLTKLLCSLLLVIMLTGCVPTPEANVVGYLITQRTGRLTERPQGPTGTLRGLVNNTDGHPIAGATVLVAERNGRPHAAQTGMDGRYRIENIPPGRYVPAAIAPGYTEMQLQTALGNAQLVTMRAEEITEAPLIELAPYRPPRLPIPLAEAVELTVTATAVVTAVFPVGSEATVQAYQFDYADAQVDTLRLYLPTATEEAEPLPLLYMVYPTATDLWQSVSTAYAAQGYAVLAISPIIERGLDIDAHATDARVGLALAKSGALSERIQEGAVVALGGSFSSAILHRLIRNDTGLITGWVTVGGITNAFSGAADFYAGNIVILDEYEYLVPALGAPNLYPLNLLRYSPVYTAAQLPPTLIIHTAVDRIIPIAQAYELEAALRTANVPTEVFYYEDVSHYLQIDDQMTDAGREMFYRVLTFADGILKPGKEVE